MSGGRFAYGLSVAAGAVLLIGVALAPEPEATPPPHTAGLSSALRNRLSHLPLAFELTWGNPAETSNISRAAPATRCCSRPPVRRCDLIMACRRRL